MISPVNRSVLGPVSVREDSGGDLGIDVGCHDRIFSVDGEEEVHGFLMSRIPLEGVGLVVDILLSDGPHCCSFWSHNSSVLDAEMQPVVVEAMGVERVARALEAPMVIKSEGVGESILKNSSSEGECVRFDIGVGGRTLDRPPGSVKGFRDPDAVGAVWEMSSGA